MKHTVQKDILLSAVAGVVLVAVNAALYMGIRNGQIAPAENLVLWRAFAVLNVCSLLWAVSLLGLHPMVVAVSYTAGGFMAYQGVRFIPGVHVAEIAAAGAVYGAFGALVVGHATTRVRRAFFAKRQVPFVFVIVALLLVDSLLSSRVLQAGWNVVAQALMFPFLVSGVFVGLAWMVFVRIRMKQAMRENVVKPVAEQAPVEPAAAADEAVSQLIFSVPESAASVEAEGLEGAAAVQDPESLVEEGTPAPVMDAVSPQNNAVEEDDFSDDFFPLEIDKGEDELTLEENADLMGVAAMVAEYAPDPVEEIEPLAEVEPVVEVEPAKVAEPVKVADPVIDTVPAVKESVVHSEEAPLPASDPEPVDKPEKDVLEKEGTAHSEDWLNSHLSLLNKLN